MRQLNPSSLVGDTTTRYRGQGNEWFAFPLMNCSELHICYNLRIYMLWFGKINENFSVPKALTPVTYVGIVKTGNRGGGKGWGGVL